MSHRKRQSEPEVAKEILGYFLRNPEVADTLEGVARWRLLEERIHHTLMATHKALHWLVLQGFLVDTSTGSGQAFRLNAQKSAEANHFLGSRGYVRKGSED